MATLKLKPKTLPPSLAPSGPHGHTRPPVRGSGSGVRARPTLAEAQAERAEREARYQAQLRERQAGGPGGAAPARHRDGAAPRRTRDDQAGPRSRRDDGPGQARRDEGAPRRGPGGPPPRRDTGPRAEGPGPARRNDPRSGDRPPRRDEGPWGARPPGRPGPGGPGGRPEPAFDTGRAAERSSRRPSPTWNEPAGAPGRPPRPGRPPEPGPNTAFGGRPTGRPSRPQTALEPARRHTPRPMDNEAEAPAPVSAPGSLRLSKYMGELGIASRREADEWIAKGWVRVDGRVVNELGSRVVPGQHVTVDAQARYVQAQKVTVLIHKPVGYVSGQAEDGYEPALVLVKPANQWTEDRSGTRWIPQHLRSLVPAGRLDIDSVGLLVLTQDGRVAKQLIGEHSDIEKEYLVRVAASAGDGRLSDEGLALLRHGLELDGEPLRPAQVEWANEDQLRFVLREGKKRQIRRMCEAVGLKVLGLKRVRIGRVMLGDLPAGQWRYLRADEGFA